MESCMLIIAWVSLILSIVIAYALHVKKKSGSLHSIAIGVFIAGVALFFPVFNEQYPVWHSILYAIIRTIQMFILNSAYDGFTSMYSDGISQLLEYTLGLLHIAAPVLSATAVLAAISDRIPLLTCCFSIHKDKYIFSEINKKSLTLAVSIKNTRENALIVFLDDNTHSIEQSLLDSVKKNGFLTVKISAEHFSDKMQWGTGEFHYFNISEDQNKNLSDSIKLIDKNLNNPRVFVYTFSNDRKTETVLDKIKDSNPKANIRIINEAQTIAYELLRQNPVYRCLNDKQKRAEVLLIGLGNTGTEILKAMLWCNTYLDHEVAYTICDNNIQEREGFFRRVCPALDYDQYHIRFHQENVDIATDAVFRFLENGNTDYHYIVISTGDDDLNMTLALDLKSFFARKKQKPLINVLVRDEWKFDMARNYLVKDFEQDIHLFGCYKDLYTCSVMVDESVQKIAMGVNLIYEEEYNPGILQNVNPAMAYEKWNALTSVLQRSNKALALHIQYRLWEQGYTYIEEEDNEESRKGEKRIDYLQDILHQDNGIITQYARVEHARWNAYMLTEGWYPFDEGEPVVDNGHKLSVERKHACITTWDKMVKLEKAMPEKKFTHYDINFIMKTDLILNGLNHKLDYCNLIDPIKQPL